jgi:hypothetical protein
MIFLGKPTRIRKEGRPELRWLYCTDNVWSRWVSTDKKKKKEKKRRRRKEEEEEEEENNSA